MQPINRFPRISRQRPARPFSPGPDTPIGQPPPLPNHQRCTSSQLSHSTPSRAPPLTPVPTLPIHCQGAQESLIPHKLCVTAAFRCATKAYAAQAPQSPLACHTVPAVSVRPSGAQSLRRTAPCWYMFCGAGMSGAKVIGVGGVAAVLAVWLCQGGWLAGWWAGKGKGQRGRRTWKRCMVHGA
jgi:hypothetical protein